MFKTVSNWVDGLSKFVAMISGVAILGIAIMQFLEIVLRNSIGVSLPFVWEYASYIHMGAIFLAASYTLHVGGHIRVTLFQKFNSHIFECISTLVSLIISAYLSYALVKFAEGFAMSGRTSGTVNDVPLIVPGAFVAAGSCLLTLQLALRLVFSLTKRPVEIDVTH